MCGANGRNVTVKGTRGYIVGQNIVSRNTDTYETPPAICWLHWVIR